MSDAYSALLRDPRWQKLRLEIFNRDNFTCQLCFSTTQTLVVHHRWYDKGCKPWEYRTDALLTLCSDCHEQEHDAFPDAAALLIRQLRIRGALASEIFELLAAFSSIDDTILTDGDWMNVRTAIGNVIDAN